MRSWVFALTCVVTASGTAITPTQTARQLPTTRSTFASADAASRQQALVAIIQGQLQVAPEELAAIVGFAVVDPDITTREAACSVVMATAARGRGQITTEARPYWQAAAAALLTLNDQLVRVMMSDGEPRIRQSAILALGSLHGTVDSASSRIPSSLADALATAYGKESSDRVRTEIVKSFALTETESPRRGEILARALADPAPGVVQFAVTGIGRMRAPDGLRLVVDMLRHSERGVRVAAAQAVAAYGAAAKPYLPQLREALAVERDEITRKTLESTIGLIEKSKPPVTWRVPRPTTAGTLAADVSVP
jgi:HEAT repeat protein